MTDEEFQRIKEEEKEHQRQLKSLKHAVRLLERQRSVTNALEEMTSRSRQVLEDNERLIEEIALDTARNEARLDVALESNEPSPDLPDEELEAARARALVTAMRRAESPDADAKAPPDSSVGERPTKTDRPDALPEKTLGRMR